MAGGARGWLLGALLLVAPLCQANAQLLAGEPFNGYLGAVDASLADEGAGSWRRFAAANLELSSGGGGEAETFYIRKGANGTLPCLPLTTADSQAAMNKIEWYKEDKKLVEVDRKNVVVWETKGSVAYLPESGALLFRGVSNEDSGEYRCRLIRHHPVLPVEDSIEDGVVRFYVQDVPDPPQMPIVTGVGTDSVNLSWVPGNDNHHSPILHYVIHKREGLGAGRWSDWDEGHGTYASENRTQYEISGLKPFTTYSFCVKAVNAIGPGEASPVSHPIVTLRQKPDSRLSISARNVSSTSIRLEWQPPSSKEIHGEFTGYRIRYVAQQHELTRGADSAQHGWPHHHQKAAAQPSLSGPQAKEMMVNNLNQSSVVVKGLNTFTPYRFSVQVSNPAGDGPASEVLAMTDEGVPGPPMNLSILKSLDTSVKLRWLEPKAPNGILQGYQVQLHDITNNLDDSRNLSDPQSVMEHTIGGLTPNTWYLVQVLAYSRKFQGEPSQKVRFRTDVSAPSAPKVTNVTCYSEDSIKIQWQRPERFHNQIDFYYVQYRAEEEPEPAFVETALAAKKDNLLNELLITNLTAGLMYELQVLAATKSLLNQSQVYRSEPSQLYRVVLQANCESFTAYPSTENTVNTSLIIGVFCASFALALVCVSLIIWRRHCQAAYYYLDDPQTGSRGTNSPQLSETFDDTEYGSIAVPDWAKHVQRLHADGDFGFSKEFEQIQKANHANLSYSYSQLPENKHKNRYINIVAYDHTRVILRPLASNQKKPGADYINANFIDGYNKSRAYIGTQGPLVSTFDDYWRMIWEQRVVIIVMITNLQERGRRKCDMYWPKEGAETYGHIQVKLLQEVVMATYTLRTFTAKNLKLKKRSVAERTVYQYHYTNWPDHGVPDHPLPVLSFVRKSASANPAGAGAIICHCSAGCGRSGTYIVIDAMLKQIRHRQSINVVDFLKHIRSQRNYLVQTEEQYIFIHDALVEAIESGETEIASSFIAKYIQLLQTGGSGCRQSAGNGLVSPNEQQQQQLSVCDNLSLQNSQSNLLLAANVNPISVQNNGKQPPPPAIGGFTNTTSRSQSGGLSSQWSLLERQYKLVASFKAKDFNVVSALKPCNKNKNRTLNLIPLEAHRVHITPKPGTDGSDYINATFLMGFNHLREFILTQHPVHDTFSDFWQMVYDHNSQIIVLLTQMKDQKEFPQFWPQKEDEVDYGSFKVKLTQETTLMGSENGALITSRDFIMRSNQDDYELQTRIIHCPGWPECCGPLSGVFDLIQLVQNATQQLASQQRMHDGNATTITVTIGQEHEPQNGGPIIVIDKFGGTEAATFAVLTTLYKQINFEDAVDVYMYAKLAHLRRPGIWSCQDDYLFIYRAIENYASSLKESSAAAAATENSSSLTGPATGFANQTMTLDRNKHRSAIQSLKTSTMRRGQTGPTHLHQLTTADEFSNSSKQMLVDTDQNQQNLNQCQQLQLQNNRVISSSIAPLAQAVSNGALMRRSAQLQKADINHNTLDSSMALATNHSPYGNAISYGTQMADSQLTPQLLGNGPPSLTGSQQVALTPQRPNADHYLYPMS